MTTIHTTAIALVVLAATAARATDIPMDCNHDGTVTVGEIITGVNIVLGPDPTAPASCTNADSNLDGTVLVADLVRGVDAVLHPPIPRPAITRIEIVDEQIVRITGTGVVGDRVLVNMRQAGFNNAGAARFDDPAHPGSDSFCGWLNGGNQLGLGDEVTVGPDGTFTIAGLGHRVVPGFVLTNQKPWQCPTNQTQYYGLLTELRVDSVAYGGVADADAPRIERWLTSVQPGTNRHQLHVALGGADRVAAGITDGPDQLATAFGGKDEDERGVDTCTTRGLACGVRVDFGGATATYPPVAIGENDSTTCGINGCAPRDDEFDFVLSMAQAHERGASLLAFMKSKRIEPLVDGIDIDVDIHLSGKVDAGINFCFVGIGC